MLEFSKAAGRLTERLTLQPKGHREGLAEISLPLGDGDIVFFRWNSELDLDFNIHAHRGDEVDYFLNSRGQEMDGQFEAPREGHFYMMWLNPSPDTAQVEVDIWL